jgi:hypothetical protein
MVPTHLVKVWFPSPPLSSRSWLRTGFAVEDSEEAGEGQEGVFIDEGVDRQVVLELELGDGLRM